MKVSSIPSSLKCGRVTPLLKKPGLDKSDMSNFRLVTNLSTLSKLMERLPLRRLRPHIMSTGNFSDFQSAYRPGHSTETAMVKVINIAACEQGVILLLSLDILAAFDTTDLSILLGRLMSDFGITGHALNWL